MLPILKTHASIHPLSIQDLIGQISLFSSKEINVFGPSAQNYSDATYTVTIERFKHIFTNDLGTTPYNFLDIGFNFSNVQKIVRSCSRVMGEDVSETLKGHSVRGIRVVLSRRIGPAQARLNADHWAKFGGCGYFPELDCLRNFQKEIQTKRSVPFGLSVAEGGGEDSLRRVRSYEGFADGCGFGAETGGEGSGGWV